MSKPQTTTDSNYSTALLAFGAHPDDVEICCGGLIAKMAKMGYRTGVIDLTHAEMSTRGSRETRAAETAAAAKALKLSFRENLGFADGYIGLTPPLSAQPNDSVSDYAGQLQSVVRALRKHRPEVVLVPYWEERHPDHVATSELLTRALFNAGLAKFSCGTATAAEEAPVTPRQIMYYPMRYTPVPTLVIDISDSFTDKVASIKCYASQLGLDAAGKRPEKIEGPSTLLSSSGTLQMFEARDRNYGAMIGVTFGEPYVIRNRMGLSDPVAYFREFPGSNCHYQPITNG